MRTITWTELRKHPDKYTQMAQLEPIQVTKRGVVVFTMVPKGYEMGERLKTFFGVLPPDASINADPDERG